MAFCFRRNDGLFHSNNSEAENEHLFIAQGQTIKRVLIAMQNLIETSYQDLNIPNCTLCIVHCTL